MNKGRVQKVCHVSKKTLYGPWKVIMLVVIQSSWKAVMAHCLGFSDRQIYSVIEDMLLDMSNDDLATTVLTDKKYVKRGNVVI